MSNQEIFKTKTGFCHVLPDKIVLTRDGIIGDISKIVVGNNIYRILLIYGVISFIVLYIAYGSFLNGNIILSILCLSLGIYLVYGIISSINNSETPIILRNSIIKVEYKKGISGLTRPRFEILFRYEDDKIKRRLIILDRDEIEIEKALGIMRSEKLI